MKMPTTTAPAAVVPPPLGRGGPLREKERQRSDVHENLRVPARARRRRRAPAIAAAALAAAAATTARAQTYVPLVVDASGSTPGTITGGTYTINSTVYYAPIIVGNTSSGVLTVTSGGVLNCNSYTSPFYIGNTSTGVGTFNLINGGVFNSSVQSINVGGSGSGTFNVAGGTLADSTYGTIRVVASAGATGLFQMSSGNVNILTLTLGAASSPLTAAALVTGGTFNCSGSMDLGYGTAGVGVLNVSGGTTVVQTAVNLYDAYSGTSTVNLFGGATFNVSGNVDLAHNYANAVGALNVSGGTLNVLGTTSQFNVGELGKGTVLLQAGGAINDAAALPVLVGAKAGSGGTISMSGGTFNASSAGLYLGNAASGVMAQTGGTFNAGIPGVTIGAQAGATGTYNLSGGSLVTGKLVGGAGVSALNVSGGTVVLLGATPTVGGLTTATVQAGGATAFNANGGAVAVTQSFQHDPTVGAPAADGGLAFVGPGTFTLTGTSTYTGGTTLAGGVTVRANAAGSLGTGPVAVNGGSTLGGNGTVANGTNLLTVNGGGTITAGPDANTTGNLSTGSQQWNGGGTLLVKVGGTGAAVSSNDRLILSGLTIAATSGNPFNLTVTGLPTNTTTPALPYQSYIVLADDTSAAASNPFNASGTAPVNLSAFDLNISGGSVASAGGTFQLATVPDVLGGGGYDLVLTATPEPASLTLLGIGAVACSAGGGGRAPTARM